MCYTQTCDQTNCPFVIVEITLRLCPYRKIAAKQRHLYLEPNFPLFALLARFTMNLQCKIKRKCCTFTFANKFEHNFFYKNFLLINIEIRDIFDLHFAQNFIFCFESVTDFNTLVIPVIPQTFLSSVQLNRFVVEKEILQSHLRG